MLDSINTVEFYPHGPHLLNLAFAEKTWNSSR